MTWRGLLTRNSSWKAKQSIFYILLWLRFELWLRKTGCCITTTHHLTLPFHQGIFDQKQHECHSPPTLLFSVSQLKIKLKGCHAILTQLRWSRQNCRQCWTPSQNVTSRIYFINSRSAGIGAYPWMGTTSKVMMTSRPKLSFWPDGSPSHGNYRWFLHCINSHHYC
jgi:hypothetical protein